MEDDELEKLVSLMDEDSEDDIIDQLYSCDKEVCDESNVMQNICVTTMNEDKKMDSDVKKSSPEQMSKKLSEMENYIKFLEAQLKTKNMKIDSLPEIEVETADSSIPKKCERSPIANINMTTESTRNNSAKNIVERKKMEKVRTTQDSSETCFGKKARVAHTAKNSTKMNEKACKNSSGKKRKAEEPSQNSLVPQAKKATYEDKSEAFDGFSGLRILNPVVSSSVMERRMEGRKMIKISSIQSKILDNNIEGDWVTIGVIIQKIPKTTSKGEVYSIWKLSDLAFHLQTSTVSLFLFGDNHKQHWKTAEGSVVAILNAGILPSREKSSNVALTLDNSKKIMMMGTSQDFGVCHSSRKSDGKRCSNFINKSRGNYCQYHVQREYSKKRSQRMECQQGYGAPSTIPGNKLKKKIAGDSYFYAGQLVSSGPTVGQSNEKITLKSLNVSSTGGKEYLSSWKEKHAVTSEPELLADGKDGPSADFLSLLNIPSVGSRNLKRHLYKEEEREKETYEPKRSLSASEFLEANNSTNHARSSSNSQNGMTSCTEKSLGQPILGRGLRLNDDLVFDENIPLNYSTKSPRNPDRAKKLAIAYVRNAGPIVAKDPNDVRIRKPSPKQQEVRNSKLVSNDNQSDSKCGRTPSLADGFNLDSEEGKKILKAKSKHAGEVRQAEMKREQEYFADRERKEDMETKMLLTKEMKVKAFRCSQCKYVSEKPSTRCKQEKHSITSLEVLKKFFSCKECNERTVTYGQRYPTRECRQCGAKNWEKCGMWKEKNGPTIGRDTLMIRGPEYAKFMNSLTMTKTNGVLPKYL